MASDNRRSESDGCLIWIVAGFALFAGVEAFNKAKSIEERLVAAGVISEPDEQDEGQEEAAR